MSKDEAIKQLQGMVVGAEWLSDSMVQALSVAIEALSADVEPVKHGHWKVVSDGYGGKAYICECSECEDTVWVYKDANRKWNYCPNCGAKMDEKEQENE